MLFAAKRFEKDTSNSSGSIEKDDVSFILLLSVLFPTYNVYLPTCDLCLPSYDEYKLLKNNGGGLISNKISSIVMMILGLEQGC
jgi:hypothetical protein